MAPPVPEKQPPLSRVYRSRRAATCLLRRDQGEQLPGDVGVVVLPGEKGRARALREDGDVGSGAGQFAPDRKEIFQLWILNESSVDFFSEAY